MIAECGFADNVVDGDEDTEVPNGGVTREAEESEEVEVSLISEYELCPSSLEPTGWFGSGTMLGPARELG